MHYYQLVGYNVNHWVNQEVTRVTGSPINHVGIRLWEDTGNGYAINELYVSWKKTDTFVPARAVRAVVGPEIYSSERFAIFDDEVNYLKEQAAEFAATAPGTVWRPYFYHYIGRHFQMKAPVTCTSMCSDFLKRVGVRVEEDFYPSRLVADFIKEVH